VAWTLTVRSRGRVERERFSELGEVLEALDARAHTLRESAPNRPVDLRYKQLEPGQQVFARIEIAGPERLLASVRAGLDIRGDGTAEPYLGRLRRRPISSRAGEDPAAALRRALDADPT
jgi:hypothetical protein